MVDIETLKRKKKELKITFDELSDKSGIPVSTIYDIFRGITKAPRVDTLEALENALEISEEKETPVVSKETLTEDEKKLLTAYRALPEGKRGFYLEIIEQAAEKTAEKEKPAQKKTYNFA